MREQCKPNLIDPLFGESDSAEQPDFAAAEVLRIPLPNLRRKANNLVCDKRRTEISGEFALRSRMPDISRKTPAERHTRDPQIQRAVFGAAKIEPSRPKCFAVLHSRLFSLIPQYSP